MKGARVFRIAGCKDTGPGPLVGSSDSRALLNSVEVITNGGMSGLLVLMARVAEPVPEVISEYVRLCLGITHGSVGATLENHFSVFEPGVSLLHVNWVTRSSARFRLPLQ